MSGANTTLATALAFARHGHAVFPVNWPVPHPRHPERTICSCGRDLRGQPCGKNAAKHPYGRLAPNGLLSASTDPEVIRAWFTDVPMANLGLVTDKLVVIDIDPRHSGDESFAALERNVAIFPPTWRALTGGGGEHLIFRCPDGIVIKSFAAEQMQTPPLGPGIDVRARGGYIVAPPSVHVSGRAYAWSVDHHPADTELALAPDWLISKLIEQVSVSGGMGTAEQSVPEPVPGDVWGALTTRPITEYRDLAAARITGHLFRHWVDPELVLGLVRAWNAAWCKPPLSERELMAVVNRVADREDKRRDRLEQEGDQ
jgi:Bifunctional DNA primase/polymerase, N-terminal/Primase C terminal 1 (PriCT-1)